MTKAKTPKPATSIADLTPDPENARKHNARNIGQVQNSLQKYGAARSIVIDENNQIIAGNGLVEAAALAGIEKVQVVEADGETIIAVRRTGLTKKQKRELGVADNRTAELAEWNPEILAGWKGQVDLEQFWNKDELADLLKGMGGNEAEDPGAQVDKAAELQAKWGTALGQLWAIGRHRLLVGDCTVAENVARLMGGDEPILMVTDPPYGVEYEPEWRDGVDKKGLLGNRPSKATGKVENDGRVDWSDAYKLFTGNAVYCWHAGRHASAVQASLEASGFIIICQIIWTKPQGVFSRGDYHWQHEPCWYAVRKGRKHNWQGSRTETTVWQIAGMSPFGRSGDDQDATTGHGTQKPVDCMARPIMNNSAAGEIVYDPFLGSGTTLVACEKLGRSGRGMELSPAYAAVTLERLSGLGLTPELLP